MGAFLRSMAMLSLLRMAVDMLLPSGVTRRMCDMILGLIIMLSMLRMLLTLLHGGME